MDEIPDDISGDEAVARMQEMCEDLCGSGDTHLFFDDILLALLRGCDYGAVVEVFEKARDSIPFWYE